MVAGASAASTDWGSDASRLSLAGGGADASAVGSILDAGALRVASVASTAAVGAKPLARSYSCSAFETDAIVSMIDGSVNIRSVTTSSTFSRS
jgi:hypothetical protein